MALWKVTERLNGQTLVGGFYITGTMPLKGTARNKHLHFPLFFVSVIDFHHGALSQQMTQKCGFVQSWVRIATTLSQRRWFLLWTDYRGNCFNDGKLRNTGANSTFHPLLCFIGWIGTSLPLSFTSQFKEFLWRQIAYKYIVGSESQRLYAKLQRIQFKRKS